MASVSAPFALTFPRSSPEQFPEECLAAESPIVTLRCRSASPTIRRRTGLRAPLPSRIAKPHVPRPGSSPLGHVVKLQLWPSSAELQRLCALAVELDGAWNDASAEDSARLNDTDAIAVAALAELEPRLSAWRSRIRQLEAQCEELRVQVQATVDSLNGEFQTDLNEVLNLCLPERVGHLQQLHAHVTSRLHVAKCLHAKRQELLSAFVRPPKNFEGWVSDLEVEVANLQNELDSRRKLVSTHADSLRCILRELEIKILNPVDTAILAGNKFGISDGDYETVCGRLAYWEMQREQQQRIKELAREIEKIWKQLGEPPGPDDANVVAVLTGSIDVDCAASIFSELEARAELWQQHKIEASAEAERLHAALRSFASAEVAEQTIAQHGTLHKEDRAACRQKLWDLQAELRAAEEPQRQRLRQLYEITGSDVITLERFERSLDELGNAAARHARLEEELHRMEEYFNSIRVILGQLDELKALVLEGSKFETNTAAEKNRFSGNSLHFLEEEKFRKMFARRYPQIRDGLIRDIERWETTACAQFVYKGAVVRERLLSMRDAETDLLKTPGDLALVGSLLQFLNVNEVVVVKGKVGPNGRRQGLPPRDPAADQQSLQAGRQANPAHPRGRSSSNQGPARTSASRTPTPPKKSLSVPGSAP